MDGHAERCASFTLLCKRSGGELDKNRTIDSTGYWGGLGTVSPTRAADPRGRPSCHATCFTSQMGRTLSSMTPVKSWKKARLIMLTHFVLSKRCVALFLMQTRAHGKFASRW